MDYSTLNKMTQYNKKGSWKIIDKNTGEVLATERLLSKARSKSHELRFYNFRDNLLIVPDNEFRGKTSLSNKKTESVTT